VLNNRFEILDDKVRISVNARFYDDVDVFISTIDLLLVEGVNGKLTQFFHRTDKLYVMCNSVNHGRRQQTLLHHLLLKPDSGNYVAFIDGNTLNCCRDNLIEVPRGVNLKDWIEEGCKFDSDRVIGVNWNSRENRWYVKVRYKGKSRFLGSFGKDEKNKAISITELYKTLGPEEYFRQFKPQFLPLRGKNNAH
jgi:hypothetical protein